MNKKILESELIKYKENFISYSEEHSLSPYQLKRVKNNKNFLNQLCSLWEYAEDFQRANEDYELIMISANLNYNFLGNESSNCTCWFEVRKNKDRQYYVSFYGWENDLNGLRDHKEFDTLGAMLTDYFHGWHKIVCNPYFEGLKLDRQLNLEEIRHIMEYSQERGFGDIDAPWLVDLGMINADQDKCLIHSDYEKHHKPYFPSKTHDISHAWNCPSLQVIYGAWQCHTVEGGIDTTIDCATCKGKLTWFECLEVMYNKTIKLLN